MPNHFDLRIFFVDRIMRLLPRDWVYSFQAYEALEFYDLVEFIGMTLGRRTQESTRRIMELCIRASEPLDCERNGSTPIAVLNILERLYTSRISIPRFRPYLVKFDGKLYALTRSPECFDSERILELFCTEPAKKIQFAWKNYLDRKRDQASRVIQERVLEWLYRPDGPMMKKSEASFYSISAKQ
jgi:hypothetical protein